MSHNSESNPKPNPDPDSDPNSEQYIGRRPAACPPHLYAVAEQAYRNLSRDAASQAIVVSGVSGAGAQHADLSLVLARTLTLT